MNNIGLLSRYVFCSTFSKVDLAPPFLKVDKVDFSKVEPEVLAHNRSLGLLFSLNLFLQLISVGRNNLVIDNEIIIVLVQFGQNPCQRLVHN